LNIEAYNSFSVGVPHWTHVDSVHFRVMLLALLSRIENARVPYLSPGRKKMGGNPQSLVGNYSWRADFECQDGA